MRVDETVSIVRVTLDDLPLVDSIFDDLKSYSLRIDGATKREGAAYEFATARPPGHGSSAKHAFLAKREGAAIGLLDVVSDYPSSGTAFIGLLAVRESLHGLGFGRTLFLEAEGFILHVLEAKILRLAVVETNPVIGFWKKVGFHPTGEVKPYDGKAVSSQVVLMEKRI